MLQELILVLTQFGGGPGDPANNVVRFLLAAFFWVVLLVVSMWMWRTTRDRRHLYFSISAAVGVTRELFMFTAEYGSFRGFISFSTIFRYYPPLEHAVATLSILLMGYAFLRFYFNFDRFARQFLIGSTAVTILTYLVIAPLWIRFLDTAARVTLNGSAFIGAQFHDFPGDLVFRLVGALVTLFILAAFVYARSCSARFPWLAFMAFLFFFMDDALQAFNDLYDDSYAPVFAPLRHCLHIAAIVQLVGVYWWETTRQLRDGKQLLQNLLDAIPDHIFYKDLQGVYLGCNQTFAEQFVGAPKSQIVGRHEVELVADPLLVQQTMQNDRDTSSASVSEHPFTLADGRQVVLETIKASFHDAEGRVAGLIGVSRDISERRILEEQLQQSQKLEAVGLLAGGVAHDFNNILTAIIGFATLMEFEIVPDHPQAHHLEQIQQAAERASTLVQNLMAFSRRETVTATCCDLNQIVEHVQDFLRRIIPEDIHLQLDCCDSALEVCVDNGQIEQVLANLVANARDAMPKGGLLTVSTQHCLLDDDFAQRHGFGSAGRYALLSVADTGHGMDAETCKRIFEPFFTTKPVGKGTGLGLAMVYGIVQRHKGFVTVTSQPGGGSAFQIYLPIVATKAEKSCNRSAAALPEPGSETILVAEDEPAVREVVESALRKFGYTVITANDGREAVQKFTDNRASVKLVVMDIIMPVMNGKDAADAMRQLQSDVKILFSSGYTAEIIRSRAELEVGEELIVKPVKPLELLRKIRQMLDT